MFESPPGRHDRYMSGTYPVNAPEVPPLLMPMNATWLSD